MSCHTIINIFIPYTNYLAIVCILTTTSPYHQQPRHTTNKPFHATNNLVIPQTTLSYHQQPCHTTNNLVIPPTALSYHQQPCHTTNNLVIPPTTLSYHQNSLVNQKQPCHTTNNLVIPPTTLSYHQQPCQPQATLSYHPKLCMSYHRQPRIPPTTLRLAMLLVHGEVFIPPTRQQPYHTTNSLNKIRTNKNLNITVITASYIFIRSVSDMYSRSEVSWLACSSLQQSLVRNKFSRN